MQVEIFINKSVDENAGIYFNESKKAKKKIDGTLKAISYAEENISKIDKEDSKIQEEIAKKQSQKHDRKLEWFEQFRWFYSSNNFLVIGGRDANTNETVIKKHVDKDDVIFHTEYPGSPFVIIKTNGKTPERIDLEEAAQFTGNYSKAWKNGLSSAEVFYVSPEQVSKSTKAGEFMGKGSFMIYGKRNFLKPILKVAIGFVEDHIEASVPTAIRFRTKNFIEIVEGSEKASNVAKQIRKMIGGELDDIVKALPAGGCRIAKSSLKK